jgi:hypothetical protein
MSEEIEKTDISDSEEEEEEDKKEKSILDPVEGEEEDEMKDLNGLSFFNEEVKQKYFIDYNSNFLQSSKFIFIKTKLKN